MKPACACRASGASAPGLGRSPRLALPSRVLEPRDLLRTPIITNPAPSHLYRDGA